MGLKTIAPSRVTIAVSTDVHKLLKKMPVLFQGNFKGLEDTRWTLQSLVEFSIEFTIECLKDGRLQGEDIGIE